MRASIYNKKEQMLDLLEKLVNIDSGSYDKIGVDAIAGVLIELYEAMGFIVEEFPNEELGNNYKLVHKDAKKPQILIVAHLDTVFPSGTVRDRPFTMDDNRAYGPGVIDMKASHVLTYFAIKSLFEHASLAYLNIEILLNCDEEIGSPTSRKIIEALALDKSWALIMEPARANGAIVSARRGVGSYELVIEGKASHSGIAPQDGISAIQELAYKIQELHALSRHEEGISVNVGLISGGSSVNTVAAQARAEIDLRITTEAQGIELDEAIHKICTTNRLPGIKSRLTGGINRPPMVKTAESSVLVELVKTEAQKIGLEIDDVFTGGGRMLHLLQVSVLLQLMV